MSLLKDAIASRMEQINEYIKYTGQAAIADAVVAEFPNQKDGEGNTTGIRIEGTIHYSGVDIIVRNMVKIADATPVLRFLASKGYRLRGDAEKMTYTAGWQWKVSGDEGTIEVRGHFADQPEATCKMVQTGSKTVEQPIYEMQCEEVVPPSAEETTLEGPGESSEQPPEETPASV